MLFMALSYSSISFIDFDNLSSNFLSTNSIDPESFLFREIIESERFCLLILYSNKSSHYLIFHNVSFLISPNSCSNLISFKLISY